MQTAEQTVVNNYKTKCHVLVRWTISNIESTKCINYNGIVVRILEKRLEISCLQQTTGDSRREEWNRVRTPTACFSSFWSLERWLFAANRDRWLDQFDRRRLPFRTTWKNSSIIVTICIADELGNFNTFSPVIVTEHFKRVNNWRTNVRVNSQIRMLSRWISRVTRLFLCTRSDETVVLSL